MGGWWRSADLREGCALAHSGGRCAPERLRAWTLRDSGRVPLSPQKNAKDGERRTQLAALRQVSAAIQRILLRAKRKPTPSIQTARSRRGTGAGCWRELGTYLSCFFRKWSYMYREMMIVGVNTMMFATARKIRLPI